jgi:hypothetical protein
MLQDGALDLETEESMKKLLERGVAPKSAPRSQPENDASDSEFSSRVIQTLTDTKLWKALQAKANDVLESAKIYISNRVERDAKLLASIGIFAWERAVRDTARALPAAGSSSAAVGRAVRIAARQLGNSSSFNEMQEALRQSAASVREQKRSLEDLDLYEELNTPLDEIKSVTQSILNILKGDAVSSATSQRGLKSAAPAGNSMRSERQQRAYQKRKQTVLKWEKESGINVGRVAGGFADAAWQVRRELTAETSRPGYKTETIRTAIAAGAGTTSRVITAAREGDSRTLRNILFGSRAKEQLLELEEASPAMDELEMPPLPELPEIPPEPSLVLPELSLPVELLDEQASVVSRLKFCIERPEETWLTPDVLSTLESPIDSEMLREVVTAMICSRDDLEVVEVPKTVYELVENLRKVKNDIDMVDSLAAAAAGIQVASKLSNTLYGSDPNDGIQPTLLALDEIQESYLREVDDATREAQAAYEAAVTERETVIQEWERIFDEREEIIQRVKDMVEPRGVAANEKAAKSLEEPVLRDSHRPFYSKVTEEPQSTSVAVEAAPIDVAYEKAASDLKSFSSVATNFEVVLEDDEIQSSFAEVINEEEYDSIIGETFRTVTSVSLDDEEEDERNILAQLTLRSLDIVFAAIEKSLFVVLPGILKVVDTASRRVDGVSRGGLGKFGWTRIVNTERGSKRY